METAFTLQFVPNRSRLVRYDKRHVAVTAATLWNACISTLQAKNI